MAEETFRSAKEIGPSKVSRVEPHDPEISPVEEPTYTPLVMYSELKGYPYTAEYFEVKEIYKSPDIGLYKEVMDIEDAYKHKVAEGELEDGKSSFKAFIEQAEKATNTTNASKVLKISKIASWVRFMNDLSAIERRFYGKSN